MTVHHHGNQASDMPSTMSELLSLIENDIPEGRQSLQDSNSNLDKVADYCESNYFQAENKRMALEETKNYTTQSLASVAYQVNTLAYNLLHMLDLQTAQLAEMEAQVNHISQDVSIHKEKVARREIGVLTNNKTSNRQHKILVPANPERPIKYIRKPIDFSVLDDIGHGVKITTTNTPRAKRTPSQASKNGSGIMSMPNSGPAPTTKPPTPPQTVRSVGSLSRGSKEYRTPAPPIAPPQVPSNYAPNYPIGHPRAHENRRGSGYSTLPISMAHQGGQIANAMHSMQRQSHYQQSQQQQQQAHHQQSQHPHQQPQVGMVHPLTHHAGQHSHYNHSTPHNHYVPPSPTPPPPPPPMHDVPVSPLSDSLPEPPQHLQQHHSVVHQMADHHMERHANASPPLPPPPPMDDQSAMNLNNLHMNNVGMNNISIYNHNQHSNAYHSNATGSYRRRDEPEWVPENFIEKAIYDYNADKDDELSFQENSVIYVIRKNDDGWYEGVMDGITGLFPGNYVEPCL